MASKKNRKNKVELLAPAGNPEKLKYALHYGADAVYAGVPDFSLRVRINNFTPETLKEATEYVHKRKKKIYATLNIYAHNRHIENIEKHLRFLKKIKIDGIIASDPGIIRMIKKYAPGVEIHLSTQANATNWQAVQFWYEQGVRRVVLAREVTLAEIREIKKRVPKMELEYFIHGAMCMSYSGRCILSKWMTGRSANLGDCTQPCRWQYKKTERVYETSMLEDKGRYVIDMEEDQHGTYFLNSYDLNLLEYIEKLIDAGVDSLKIEGRAKSIYYLVSVTRAYCKVMDAILSGASRKKLAAVTEDGKNELNKLVHRGYTCGFLTGREPEHNIKQDTIKGAVKFVGEIEGAKGGLNIVKVHNEIFLSDKLEALDPENVFPVKIKKMYNHKMEEVGEAHGGHEKRYFIEFDKALSEKALIRKEIAGEGK